jgi:hypothetical protein
VETHDPFDQPDVGRVVVDDENGHGVFSASHASPSVRGAPTYLLLVRLCARAVTNSCGSGSIQFVHIAHLLRPIGRRQLEG